jgi:hypothetical protein
MRSGGKGMWGRGSALYKQKKKTKKNYLLLQKDVGPLLVLCLYAPMKEFVKTFRHIWGNSEGSSANSRWERAVKCMRKCANTVFSHTVYDEAARHVYCMTLHTPQFLNSVIMSIFFFHPQRNYVYLILKAIWVAWRRVTGCDQAMD